MRTGFRLAFLFLIVALLLAAAACGSGKGGTDDPLPPVLDEDGRLPAPANFRVSQGSHAGGVLLSWDRVPGAEGYAIGFINSDLETVELGDVDSWLDSSILPGEIRQYWLQALAEKRGRSTEIQPGFRAEAAGSAGGSGGAGSYRGIDRMREAAVFPAPGGPALIWNNLLLQDTNLYLHDALIADDGSIYVNSFEGLSALNGKSGDLLWSVPGAVWNASLGRDGTIFGAAKDYFFARKPDGRPLWVRRCDKALLGPLYSHGGRDLSVRYNGEDTIYVLIADAQPSQLLGFSTAGELLWLIEAPEHDASQMLISPAGELLIVDDHDMSLVSPQGELRWSIRSEQGFSDPSFCLAQGIITERHSTLVLYSYSGTVLRSLDLDCDGQWLTGHDGQGRVVLTEYFFADERRSLRAIDINAMEEHWRVDLPEGSALDCLFAADGRSFYNIEEQLICLDSSGQELWRYPVHESFRMSLGGDGTLLLLCDGGTVTALRGLDGVPAAPGGLMASKKDYAGAVRISWDIAPGALGYRISRGTQEQYIKTLGSGHSYIDQTAPAEGAQYWVRAFNEHGDGPPAGPVSGRPAVSASGPAHWAQRGGDSEHSHRSALEGPRSNRRAWEYILPNHHYGTRNLLVTDQGFVVAVASDSIYCIDSSGRLLWSVLGRYFSMDSAVLAAGGRLYINDSDGKLLAMERYGELRELTYGDDLGLIKGIGANGELYLQKGGYEDASSISVLNEAEELISTIEVEEAGRLLAAGRDGRLYMELAGGMGYSEYGSAVQNVDLRVLDASGEELWRFDPESLALPLGEGEAFIAAHFDEDLRIDQHGNVFVLARHTYQPEFNRPQAPHSASSLPPLPQDSTALVALDSSGQLLWQEQGSGAPWAVSAEGGLLHQRAGNYISRDFFSINASGELLPAGSLPYADIDGYCDDLLLDASGTLFAKFSSYNSGFTGGLVAFDANGALLWNSYSEDREVLRGSMAIGPARSLYFMEAPRRIVCIRP